MSFISNKVCPNVGASLREGRSKVRPRKAVGRKSRRSVDGVLFGEVNMSVPKSLVSFRCMVGLTASTRNVKTPE
jgi:hypothetical protein